MASLSHKRPLMLWAAVLLGTAALFYLAPLFRVVPLKAARQQSASAAFDASAFAEKFWSERLLAATDQAVDAAALCAALVHDPKAARATHGRKLGLSSTYSAFVSGTGRVTAVDGKAITVALSEGGTSAGPSLLIDTGPVFGNALRDGTGFLNVSDFPNSQDFNAISSELNRRVEERVLPAFREQAVIGQKVRVVGCVEIAQEDTGAHPLRVVPCIAEVLP